MCNLPRGEGSPKIQSGAASDPSLLVPAEGVGAVRLPQRGDLAVGVVAHAAARRPRIELLLRDALPRRDGQSPEVLVAVVERAVQQFAERGRDAVPLLVG